MLKIYLMEIGCIFYISDVKRSQLHTPGKKEIGCDLLVSVLNLGFNYLDVKTIFDEAGYETEPMHKGIFDR